MNKTLIITISIFIGIYLTSCNDSKNKKTDVIVTEQTSAPAEHMTMQVNDGRISLKLNPMQKQHQLKNMRNHLDAVQQIIILLSDDNFENASKVAYKELGSTTEMKLMCASFGDKRFETLGLEFHKSADLMSEIFKKGNKKKSLKALSTTMNYCIQCHATYRQ